MFKIYSCPKGFPVIVTEEDIANDMAFCFDCCDHHPIESLKPTDQELTEEQAIIFWQNSGVKYGYTFNAE